MPPLDFLPAPFVAFCVVAYSLDLSTMLRARAILALDTSWDTSLNGAILALDRSWHFI